MEKVCGPIFMGRSTSPITGHLEPLKDPTIRSLGFIKTPSRVNFTNVGFGMIFNEDPVSTNTQDRIVSRHFIEMCMALLCTLPSYGNSSSLKPRQLLVVLLAKNPSN